jgi:hypothetical protein
MADLASDEEVEAPKVAKPKRPQTEAQKENFRKALAARAANVAKRNETKDERIINKKLTTLAAKAEKLRSKIPPKDVVPEVVRSKPEDGDDESEPEIVIIKKKPKKKRIVVVEPDSESEDEPEEVIQKPKPRAIAEPRACSASAQRDAQHHVVVPRVNNLRFY